MIRRTVLLFALIALAFAAPGGAAAEEPDAPLRAIYQRVVNGLRTGSDARAATSIWSTEAQRKRHFSERMVKLWREADRRTPRGDQGPLGFDPVTNSQDPQVAAFDTAVEKREATTATVIVRLTETAGPITQPEPRNVIRYDMVLERGRWMIDDIRGTIDAEAWSVRGILTDYIALCDKPANRESCRR